MRWRNRQQSTNVDDRRGQSGGRKLAIGGGAGIIVIILGLIFGFDLRGLVNPGGGQQGGEPRQPSPEEEELAAFVTTIKRDTEIVWGDQLHRQRGVDYRDAELVLYTGNVTTDGCGFASSSVGPFYCPGDEKIYIDLSFFQELKTKFGAPGDFAVAYVLAHEVGHHIQHLLGDSDRARAQGRRFGETENEVSVRVELQADFYAGVWAHHGQKQFDFLESGDLKEAIRAAEVVGDDAIQKKMGGRVNTDSFTHGSSAQRMRWFMKGFRSGKLADGDQLFQLPYDEL